ncbi:unnamed protein product [Candida verbasci]|uniref:Autophagy-related protein 18 n=1 Tax=Candida verbasci TaxID=1227364 RepID=A0A9W4TWB7_9ASCO|nr:unnamed protein product [Candida verbasci]
MIKSSANTANYLTRQYSNDASSSITNTSSIKHNNYNDLINYVNFNQDSSCISLGLNSGYKIYNIDSTKNFNFIKNESIGIVEMLYSTSLLAIVNKGEEIGSSPRKLKIINIKNQSTICDLIFPNTILSVKLTKKYIIVILEDQIYIYDINNMKLLHTIETSTNSSGLVAISYNETHSYLAYPSPPKTITHDSLLASGINTNGGLNSNINNISSVSNAPNRIGDVIIFNLNTLQPISVIEAHKSTIASMNFSNDGQYLVTASDKGTIVRIFQVNTGIKLYQFRRGTYPTKIYSLKFSSDDKYVLATSSSLTVHIFRLGEEESLETKHKKKRKEPIYEPIQEEEEITSPKITTSSTAAPILTTHNVSSKNKRNIDDFDTIKDDGDDSDATMDLDDGELDEDTESMEVIPNKQRKLSQESSNSYSSINSEDILANNSPKNEPLIDQTRLSVARLIRRSSQNIGRKVGQKMGDFLPSKFSSILEPTRHFASFKIKSHNKEIKSIAVMSNNELQQDLVPTNYFENDNQSTHSSNKELLEVNLLHIYVITNEGMFYIYGLDPERGGDCILINSFNILDD